MGSMRITQSSVGHDTFFAAHLHAHFDSTEYFPAAKLSKQLVTSWELPSVLRNTVTGLFKVAWQCAISTPRLMLGNQSGQDDNVYNAAKHEAMQDGDHGPETANLTGQTVAEHLWPMLLTIDATIHVRELVTLAPC